MVIHLNHRMIHLNSSVSFDRAVYLYHVYCIYQFIAAVRELPSLNLNAMELRVSTTVKKSP